MKGRERENREKSMKQFVNRCFLNGLKQTTGKRRCNNDKKRKRIKFTTAIFFGRKRKNKTGKGLERGKRERGERKIKRII